jgi:phosphatidylinositol alpha-1,6-mannosyltransferase
MARITLVSRNFPPLSGGMERLVFQLYLGLVERHDVQLLGPGGCKKFAATARTVRATRVSPTPVFLFLTLMKGMVLRILSGAADIVIGGSGLVGIIVILLAKVSGARSVVLLHGLDIIADSRVYQTLFVPFLRMADVAICNSRNTARLATEYGVDAERIVIINPGVELPGKTPTQESARQQLGYSRQKILLSVGRLMPRKGLAEFIDQSLPELVADDPDWLLLIAGSEPANALNRPRESVLHSIHAAVSRHGLEDQVRLLGHVSEDNLVALYAAADVFVFPLIEMPGDVEGFGMVAIEAAAFGTPTVAFDCGGVGDAVVDGVNGTLVAAGDYQGFANAIRHVQNANLRQSARDFAHGFSWRHYNAQIDDCLGKVLN